MKPLTILSLLLSATISWGGMTAAEQYQALKVKKAEEDRKAEARLEEDIRAVLADRDLAIYNGFLGLHHEHGLEEHLLKFTGTVMQKVNAVFGKKLLVIHVKGSKGDLDVTAIFKEKIPDEVQRGDPVTLSGIFEKGNLIGVTLAEAMVMPVISQEGIHHE